MAVRVQDTVVAGSQVIISERVELYSWDYLNDPILLRDLMHPTPGHPVFDAYGLWAQTPGLSSTTPLLQYLIPDLDPSQNVGWIEHPTHAWNKVSAFDHGLDAAYFESIIGNGTIIEIDTSSARHAFNRPQFSVIDFEHRSRSGAFGVDNNVHGVGFNDIGYETMPLHKQLFDSGFGVVGMDTHGISGSLVVERVLNVDVGVDYFGNITGSVGNRFIRPKHVPVGVSHVIETVSGNDVPYTLHNDVIVLGTDFVGGGFSTYPEFVRTVPYSVGDRVHRIEAGIDHLYEAVENWIIPASSTGDGFDPFYFQELFGTDLDVGYYYIGDFEYSLSGDNSVYLSPNNTSTVVSEGIVLDPTPIKTQKRFSLGPYKNVIVDKMTLGIDKASNIVASQTVLDSADLSLRRSGSELSTVLASTSQLKVQLHRTPRTYDLAPPEGVLTLDTTAVNGRYRFFYTYGLNSRDIHTTTSQLSSYSGKFNLQSAQLIEGVNYIPRDSWEYSGSDNKIVVASDVYRYGRTYTIIRSDMESPRNHRGYVEVLGSAPKPAGTAAHAVLEITEYPRLGVGDSITVVLGSGTDGKSVTKTLQGDDGSVYTGFVKGLNTASTLANIAACFNTDPVFKTKAVASVVGATCVFTSTIPGSVGNSWSISVSSLNTAFTTTSWSGGSDHVWSRSDLVGLKFTIADKMLWDDDAYFSLWCTGDIDSGADPNTYTRLASVADTNSGTVLHTVTESDITSSSDVYNIGSEPSLSLRVEGTDMEGNSVSETLDVNHSTFCDIQNYRVWNPYQFVRTKNLYASVTGWSVLEAVGVGSSMLVLIAESASGTRDLFETCDLSWTGSRIRTIKDKRVFVDAVSNRPTSTVSAEALSNIAALLQL